MQLLGLNGDFDDEGAFAVSNGYPSFACFQPTDLRTETYHELWRYYIVRN